MNPITPPSLLEQAFNYLASANWLLVLLSVSAFSLFVIASCVFIEIFGEGQFGVAWRKFKRPALRLLPDWKRILRKAWSVRVLALLAALDFVGAIILITVDGAAEAMIADHTTAIIFALAVKSLLSIGGIWLRVRAQSAAEDIEDGKP